MAENLPNGNDAGATGATSQEPQNQPSGPSADVNQQQPTLTFDSFDEDQKKYLAGQGITKQEELTSEAIVKLVNHARSSQQTLAERQAEIERLKNGGGTQNPTSPTNANGEGATGAQSNTQQPTDQVLDPVTAFNLAGTLRNQFPKLADKLADESFYSDMQKEGYQLTVNGQVNIDGITKYASRLTKELEVEEKLAEANKPNPIPSADGGTSMTFDANSPMTLEVARAMVLTDKTNPRFAEAQKYLQDNVGRK